MLTRLCFNFKNEQQGYTLSSRNVALLCLLVYPLVVDRIEQQKNDLRFLRVF
jgi:hypothetical protein